MESAYHMDDMVLHGSLVSHPVQRVHKKAGGFLLWPSHRRSGEDCGGQVQPGRNHHGKRTATVSLWLPVPYQGDDLSQTVLEPPWGGDLPTRYSVLTAVSLWVHKGSSSVGSGCVSYEIIKGQISLPIWGTPGSGTRTSYRIALWHIRFGPSARPV